MYDKDIKKKFIEKIKNINQIREEYKELSKKLRTKGEFFNNKVTWKSFDFKKKCNYKKAQLFFFQIYKEYHYEIERVILENYPKLITINDASDNEIKDILDLIYFVTTKYYVLEEWVYFKNKGKIKIYIPESELYEYSFCLCTAEIISGHYGRGNKPIMNIPESKLNQIIVDNSFDFTFVGQRKKENRIGRKYPDFRHITKKKLIEMHGDYWHNCKYTKWHGTEWGTKAYYSQLGYDCLVIWESELLDVDSVIKKIRKFIEK